MRRSVFWKLFAICLGVWLGVSALLVLGLPYAAPPPPPGGRAFMERQRDFYLRHLASQLGQRPTRAAVEEVAASAGMGVRVETDDGVIATGPEVPDWQTATAMGRRPPGPPPGPRPWLGPFGALFRRPPPPVSAVEVDGARYVFAPAQWHQPEVRSDVLALVVAAASAILLAGYVLLRKLLRPVRWLMGGVVALGEGRLDHQVPVRGGDELAELGRAFNATVARVRETLEAKEQLLLDVSHELRSPIGRMRVAVELLDDDKGKTRLVGNLAELEKLVHHLLESARLDRDPSSLRRAEVDLVELTASCCDAYAEHSPGVTLAAPAGRIPARVDEARMLSVLRNLIENALKYSAGREQAVAVTVEDLEDRHRISVEDFGVGIPAADLARVFEPFYRVDKSRSKESGGYGLGLGLCRKVVRAHGGELVLTSREGHGTRAVVTLPKASA